MSVILNITGSSQTCEQYVLRTGEVAIVGRSPWADISLAWIPDLEEEHFRVDCRHAVCRVEALNGSLLRNKVKIDSALLDDGDTLSAGNVDISIRFVGLTQDRGYVEPLKLIDKQGPSLDKFSEVLFKAKLSSAGQERVVSGDQLATFDALLAAGLNKDACRFAVAILPPSVAVTWAVQQLSEISHLTSEDQDQLLDYIAGQRNTLSAEQIDLRIEALAPNEPDAWLWKAARWSGGSLSKAGQPPVPPAPYLFAVAMSVAVALAAVQRKTDVFLSWMSAVREQIILHTSPIPIDADAKMRASA